jgi:hypothetical protein
LDAGIIVDLVEIVVAKTKVAPESFSDDGRIITVVLEALRSTGNSLDLSQFVCVVKNAYDKLAQVRTAKPNSLL